MHALKLARAFTKRDKIGKFEGHFHVVLEPLYVAVGSPPGEPESAGHDPLSAKNTVILPFNDLEATSRIIRKELLACVIIEPVKGGDSIPADREFLKGLREVCEDTDTLLIFDEVITGFRLAAGGAQEAFGVTPDLTTFGKAIGGGEFPVGAVGGRSEIMELADHIKHPKKSEHVVQGGTYSGNPLVMRAGYEATKEYEKGDMYAHINRLGERLMKGLQDAVERTNINAYVTGWGSMVKLHFPSEKAQSKDKPLRIHADTEVEKRYFRYLLSNGLFAMTPNQVHFYVSLAHTEEEITETITKTEGFLKSLR